MKKNTDPWQQTTVPPLRVILVLLSSSHLSNAIKDRKKSPPVHWNLLLSLSGLFYDNNFNQKLKLTMGKPLVRNDQKYDPGKRRNGKTALANQIWDAEDSDWNWSTFSPIWWWVDGERCTGGRTLFSEQLTESLQVICLELAGPCMHVGNWAEVEPQM